ncbi:MAG: glycosyltransferase [Alphaproteobacteria bacterium]|nr:glycosyltransferase [Alphaproteobacteria bacterium]
MNGGSLPAARRLRIVILGLSITSSWGNGHATTYRGLVNALARRGHDVVFLERDQSWYRDNRDLPHPPYGETVLYGSVDELQQRWREQVYAADLVIVGSYVPDGIAVCAWVQQTAGGITAFYDIDTPVTLSALQTGTCQYLAAEQIAGFDLYLSFTGGPLLRDIEDNLGSPAARPLYCAVDPQIHMPQTLSHEWDLGYLGTYSTDRQPTLDRLLCEPARAWSGGKFVVAGPLYPADLIWPENVRRVEHLEPAQHSRFFAQQRFTLNVTRADMIRCGYSPSVRLFEAAASGVPIISDWWDGLDTFFEPDREILIARDTDEALRYLRDIGEAARQDIAQTARVRVLAHHTATHRAVALESYVEEVSDRAVSRGSPAHGDAIREIEATR